LRKIETEHAGERQEAWRPKVVYHYIQWENLEPDFVLDVTGFIQKKIDAVLAYSSQFYDPSSKEPESPISSKNFLESVEYRAKDLGRLIGREYAEGFNTERFAGIDQLDDLI
jgi:LmbE family N-acetylglucosaminyl deacetylase